MIACSHYDAPLWHAWRVGKEDTVSHTSQLGGVGTRGLPENDRVRYTISPAARKEVLRRLLALNHARAEEEAKASAPGKRKKTRQQSKPEHQPSLLE